MGGLNQVWNHALEVCQSEQISPHQFIEPAFQTEDGFHNLYRFCGIPIPSFRLYNIIAETVITSAAAGSEDYQPLDVRSVTVDMKYKYVYPVSIVEDCLVSPQCSSELLQR